MVVEVVVDVGLAVVVVVVVIVVVVVVAAFTFAMCVVGLLVGRCFYYKMVPLLLSLLTVLASVPLLSTSILLRVKGKMFNSTTTTTTTCMMLMMMAIIDVIQLLCICLAFFLAY